MNQLFLPLSDDNALSSDYHTWCAKIQMFTVAASNMVTRLSSQQLFALGLFTSESNVSMHLNRAIASEAYLSSDANALKTQIGELCSALNNIDPFIGECYIGSRFNQNFVLCSDLKRNFVIRFIDRKMFTVGSEVTFPAFVSATSLWRIATNNVPDFSTKKREGVVFIIKSLTGRFVANYSRLSNQSEVLFSPFAKFKVTNW